MIALITQKKKNSCDLVMHNTVQLLLRPLVILNVVNIIKRGLKTVLQPRKKKVLNLQRNFFLEKLSKPVQNSFFKELFWCSFLKVFPKGTKHDTKLF